VKTYLRASLLAGAVLPPAVWVILQELQAADLIRICELGCGSPASGLLFLSVVSYVVLTPALIVACLGTMGNLRQTWRALGLIAIFFLPYVLFFGGIAFLGSPDPFLANLLPAFPVPLALALGYLVVRANPATLAAAILLPILPAILLAPAAFPQVTNGYTGTCSTAQFVNASSSFTTQYTSCSSVPVAVSSTNFADYYLFLLLLTSVALAVYTTLFNSRTVPAGPA
jgi:hypothetical protein